MNTDADARIRIDRRMYARKQRSCPLCPLHTRPGQLIGRTRWGWAHVACVLAWNKQFDRDVEPTGGLG